MKIVHALLLLEVLGPSGCGSADAPLAPAADSGTSSTTSTTSTTVGSSTSHSTTTAALDDTGTSTGVIFLIEHDMGPAYQCDLLEQDCPPAHKCMPWSNDGGSAWNAWGCKPLADEPVGIDERCHVEGSGVSGIDDCEMRAMCWYVDPESLEGYCVPFCVGTYEELHCEDSNRVCPIAGDGTLLVCIEKCNPLQLDCPEQILCSSTNGYDWFCGYDYSDEAGVYADVCTNDSSCAAGLVCADAAAVPDCGGAKCCTELCDLTDPTGALQCSGAADGQLCEPWYAPGAAREGYENLGVCTLPS